MKTCTSTSTCTIFLDMKTCTCTCTYTIFLDMKTGICTIFLDMILVFVLFV